MKYPSISRNVSCRKVHLSDTNRDIPTFLVFLFTWCVYFLLLTFSLYVLLNLKCVSLDSICSYRQHKAGSFLSV